MNTYKRQRFPSDIISYAVWLHYRFNLSDRDIEDALAERGINVSREFIRLWCIKFGTLYARRLTRKHQGYGEIFYIDEVFAGVPDHSDQGPYANNRAEQSHEATRVRERRMQRFKPMKQAQRFESAHATVHNLFNLGRHLIRDEHYRSLRMSAFTDWSRAVA